MINISSLNFERALATLHEPERFLKKDIFIVLVISSLLLFLGSDSSAKSDEDIFVGALPGDYEKYSKMDITVDTISPRVFPRDLQNAPREALVGLKFKNLGENKVFVPVFAVAGLKGLMLDFGGATPSSDLKLNGKLQPDGAVCATIDYQWLNADDKQVLCDSCSVPFENIELTPGGTELRIFPIKMPREKGTYSVVLTFDNRILLTVLRGSNSFLINSKVLGPQLIFRQTVSANVEIDNR
jgi:hypothetical protein